MKSLTKLLARSLALSLGLSTAALAANIDGPDVFWKISMWDKPRALSAGMEVLAKKAVEEAGGKFKIKISTAASCRRVRKTSMA
jgi:hypothetical protein